MEFTPLVPVSEWIGVGDLVVIPRSPKTAGKVFRVKKRNPKNFRLEDESGATWNADHRICEKAPEGTVFNPSVAVKAEVPRLTLGSAVTFKDDARFPGVYVLIKHLQDDRAQFARLGGDGNRYVRASLVNVAPVDDINNYGS